MFHSMRRLGSGIFAKIMVVFIAAAFGLWGVGDVLRSGGPGYAAKVGSDTISVAEFQRQKTLLDRQMQAMGVQGLDASKMEVAVLRQLIQQHLIRQETQDLGLRVNDALLAQTLRRQPQFLNKDGSFNSEAFKRSLDNLRISEAAFLAQLKDETAGRFLVSSLDMSDITPPAPVLALAATTAGETRDAILVTIPAHAPADKVTDAALKGYYEEHKLLYLTAPTRTLEYVTFAPSEVNGWIDKIITTQKQGEGTAPKITDEMRKDARDDAMRELTNGVEDALAGGSTLGGAMSKLGFKAQSHMLNNITPDSAKNREDAVEKSAIEQGLALGDGEISGVITTPGGTALMVAVKSTNAAMPKPYEDVASEVRTAFTQQLGRDEARAKAQDVKDALAKEATWQAALTKFELYGRPISNVPRAVEGKSAAYGMPIPMQEAIFERNVGQVAGPLNLPNGDQLLAIVTASHHPRPEQAKIDSATRDKLIESIGQDVEGAAYNDFARRRPIKINPQLLGRNNNDNQQ